jgi:predicted DNA-binding protein
MGIQVPPNQVVAAFLPKVLNQRIPELAEFCGADSISHLVRELVAQAIEDMDAVNNDRVLVAKSS